MAAYYYFDLNIMIVGGSVGGVLVLIGFAYGFLPRVKKYLDQHLPKLFQHKVFKLGLLACCCTIVLTGLLWTRIALDWTGDRIKISINCAEQTVGEQNDPIQSVSYFDWSWRKLNVSVGHVYSDEFEYRWFKPLHIRIPTYAMNSLGGKQRRALHLLALSFFDHDTRDHLKNANKLALPETDTSMAEIRAAHGILEYCFVTDDNKSTPDMVSSYSGTYRIPRLDSR